jgi:hypothetical protein
MAQNNGKYKFEKEIIVPNFKNMSKMMTCDENNNSISNFFFFSSVFKFKRTYGNRLVVYWCKLAIKKRSIIISRIFWAH